MLNLVSRLFTRQKHDFETTVSQIQSRRDSRNLITTTGTLLYHVDHRGFFGLLTEDGKQFFPFNSAQFPKLLKDRLRVKIVLECFENVPNYYKWGTSARIIAMEPIVS